MAVTRFAGLLVAALTMAAVSTVAHDAPAQGKAAATKKPSKKTKLEAKRAYMMGKKKMSAGNYASALDNFKKADDLVPGAAPKYQIAVCYDKLGKSEEAVAAYKTFVEINPGKKYADRVDAANKRITELEATLPAKITVVVTPANASGTLIKLDGTEAAGAELEMAAGQHTIEVTADGFEPSLETIEVKGAETREIAITLVPKEGEAPPPPLDDDDDDEGGVDGLMIGGFVGLGVGVVAGAVTAAFGVMALGSSSDFEDAPSNELADDAESQALIADVFLAIAVAGAITGGVLFTLALSGDGDEGEEGAKMVITPYGGPRGGGAAATISF